MSQKVNPNVEKIYSLGDPVFFFDDKKKEWKKATALKIAAKKDCLNGKSYR